MRRYVIFVLLIWLALFACSFANSMPDYDKVEVGKVFRCFKMDVNGDGKLYILAVKVISKDDMGWGGQLLVYNDRHNLIWKGPETKDRQMTDALSVGGFMGVSWPEAACDFDSDGKIELLIPAPQSDVRPVKYKISRWNGKEFTPLNPMRIMETQDGIFQWSDREGDEGGWLGNLVPEQEDGVFRADYLNITDGKVKSGVMLVRRTARGFVCEQWLKSASPIY